MINKMSKNLTALPPWKSMLKRIVWKQLGDIQNKKILDFGSGIGVTADYLGKNNMLLLLNQMRKVWQHGGQIINTRK